MIHVLIGAVVGAALVAGYLAAYQPTAVPRTAVQLVGEAKAGVDDISVEAYRAMQTEEVEHVLLDVREQDEWGAGHVDNSLHIPRGLLEFRIAEEIPDPSTRIVVLCKSGGRAALAGQTLQKMGYTHIVYLEGGYEALIQ